MPPDSAQARTLSYAQRVALYLSDKDSYTQIYGGKNTWTQA